MARLTGILGPLPDTGSQHPAFGGGILGGVQLAQATGQDDAPFSSLFKKGVARPSGQAGELLRCMEKSCPAGTIDIISETSGFHAPGNPHTEHQAIDLKTRQRRQAMMCGANCGARFQLDEYAHPSPGSNGGHIHLQTRAGRGGATGPYYRAPIPTPRPEDYR